MKNLINYEGFNPPINDLDFILDRTGGELRELDDKNILITGATGFIGKWIIESLIRIREFKNINFNISILSRNVSYKNFMDQKGINFILGDIVTFKLPKINYDFVIHGAAPSTILTGGSDQQLVKNIIECGTQNLLDQLSFQNSKPNFLFLSSGAVYGKSNSNEPLLETLDVENRSLIRTPYGDGKLYAEKLIKLATDSNIINGCSPRLFAFSGPYLSLNEHFAFGNFILNAVKNQPFIVKGNPYTQRSYLYISELINWIFKSLISPTTLPLNFGGEVQISIQELAQKISKLTTNAPVVIDEKSAYSPPSFYFPDISNTKKIYKIEQEIFIDQQITKFYKWAKMI